jgi:hypothetical protein
VVIQGTGAFTQASRDIRKTIAFQSHWKNEKSRHDTVFPLSILESSYRGQRDRVKSARPDVDRAMLSQRKNHYRQRMNDVVRHVGG